MLIECWEEGPLRLRALRGLRSDSRWRRERLRGMGCLRGFESSRIKVNLTCLGLPVEPMSQAPIQGIKLPGVLIWKGVVKMEVCNHVKEC